MYFEALIKDLSKRKEVVGIMLGGSRAAQNHDGDSDYDVYVYLNDALDLNARTKIIAPHVTYMEYGNEFWELEDDGILKCGTDIELIYRNTDDINESLNRTVFKAQHNMGYSTCFWDNLMHSKILYDPFGTLKTLQAKYSVVYPKALKDNIIYNNAKLLKDYMPSFYYQLEKAVKRKDLVSINHRLSELLASYFDIIFALNETLHPGEKRLMRAVAKLNKLPLKTLEKLEFLFDNMYQNHDVFLRCVNELIEDLYLLLSLEGYNITSESYKQK